MQITIFRGFITSEEDDTIPHDPLPLVDTDFGRFIILGRYPSCVIYYDDGDDDDDNDHDDDDDDDDDG